MAKRILTGKIQKIPQEDREKLRQEKLQERFNFEKGREGGYELIFPCQNDEKKNSLYQGFLQKANDLWDEFTTGNKSKKGAAQTKVEPEKKPIKPRNKQHALTD